jgi:hypothetical protein
MLGAVCHDLGKAGNTAVIDGPHQVARITKRWAWRRRRRSRSLNINTMDGFDVRAQVIGLVAEHLRPMAFFKSRETVTDGAFPAAGAESRSRAAGPLRARGLHGPNRDIRLFRESNGFSIARGRSASSTSHRCRFSLAGI